MEFFFFAVLMFVTIVVFAIMSLFYKYANGSVVNMHDATDRDSIQLTDAAESLASDPQTEPAKERH